MKAGVTLSSKDGLSAGGEARGNVGSVGGTVKVDRTGVHTYAGGEKARDMKIGTHINVGVGLGVNVNLSQASRAAQRTVGWVESMEALGVATLRNQVPSLQFPH